jgi:hypothetical protein
MPQSSHLTNPQLHISMQLVPRKTLLDIQRQIKYRAAYNPQKIKNKKYCPNDQDGAAIFYFLFCQDLVLICVN